jgi:L-lactate utilization protein LutC
MNPVAMIFARDVSDGLTSLVKKLEEATAKNREALMGSFVVFCSDDEKLEKALKEQAEKLKLKNVILALDNAAGPPGYKVAKEADVTVVLYVRHEVKANYSYKKGELTAKEVDKIIADLPKILPEKK